MSFAADARKVRNPDLPHLRRLSAFHSCVQRYKPLGFAATLSFLEQLAGRYRQDEEALLRALDMLVDSRERWKHAVTEYAKVRKSAKARGERTPSRRDPNPCHAPTHWYGAERHGALHALAFRQSHGLLPPPKDDVAADVHTLVTRTLASGGNLTTDDRELLADLSAELRRRCRCRSTNGAAIAQARTLRQLAQFITTASS
ncbi:hypothetical protein [Actinophytocola sp.]|uniref:hypothetical protein n=1 Tax=Actinophytocola sp. TaxID=1872138 RepID=UPI00389A8C27